MLDDPNAIKTARRREFAVGVVVGVFATSIAWYLAPGTPRGAEPSFGSALAELVLLPAKVVAMLLAGTLSMSHDEVPWESAIWAGLAANVLLIACFYYGVMRYVMRRC